MKRFIGLCVFAVSLICMTGSFTESGAATTNNDAYNLEQAWQEELMTIEPMVSGFEFAELTPEFVTFLDNSFTFVVIGKNPETAYNSDLIPACRGPDRLSH